MKPLYGFFHQNVKVQYKKKLEHCFDKLKNLSQMMLLGLYLTQIFQSFATVASFLIGIDDVLLRMFNKGKLDFISINYRTSQLLNENSVLPVVHQ